MGLGRRVPSVVRKIFAQPAVACNTGIPRGLFSTVGWLVGFVVVRSRVATVKRDHPTEFLIGSENLPDNVWRVFARWAQRGPCESRGNFRTSGLP